MKKERVSVYIDGGNTYRRLKSIGIPQKPCRFDYSAFIEYLLGDRTLTSKKYYVGIVRNTDNSEKAEQMVRSQQKFLNSLRTEGFDIEAGKIMYDGGDIREKGVDVKFSLDIAIGAVENLYDTAIVISSDTDLVPAIKYARNIKKKNIEYIGFGLTPSFGMIRESSVSRVLSDIDLLQFQSKTLKFEENLAELILRNKKRVTRRLFDDKNLKTGDLLNLQISETGKSFAKARIVHLIEKSLGNVVESDYDGHEKYESKEEMLTKFKKYYGNKVDLNTLVKIIKFDIKK